METRGLACAVMAVLLVGLVPAGVTAGQFWSSSDSSGPAVQAPDYADVFSAIEAGLGSANPGAFSRHMASQLFVSIPDEQSGFYSASQAFYLLDQFLQRHRLTNFRFTTIGESDGTAYATGGSAQSLRSLRGVSQVYVSLSYAGNRWVISKISIY